MQNLRWDQNYKFLKYIEWNECFILKKRLKWREKKIGDEDHRSKLKRDKKNYFNQFYLKNYKNKTWLISLKCNYIA